MDTTLENYLKSKHILCEGKSADISEQVEKLIELSSEPNINIMEIGFNAGHSSELFLKNNNTSKVLSFDLGEYNSVEVGKDYIDCMYPGRHTLILGDSKETIPKFIIDNSNIKFDLIFIDGGHDYLTAKSDLENSYLLSHTNTLIIMDDVVYTPSWEQHYTVGPTKIWVEHVMSKKIFELGSKDYKNGRGMAWGKPHML